MADFSANWSASDRPVSPYNSGTEARIEVPQTPENRAMVAFSLTVPTELAILKGVVHVTDTPTSRG